MAMPDPAAVRAVFDEAMSLPSVERSAFIERACQGDELLRREVDRLLIAIGDSGSVFESGSRARPVPPDTATPALVSGHLIGPYCVLERIGAGGMGEVYKASDTRVPRVVALKVLPTELTRDATARHRLEREARAAAALRHPRLCAFLDLGQAGETDYLVLEFLDGVTLARELESGPLSSADALTRALEVAEALGAIHNAGLVHRDLKPSNVMITGRGAIVLDFGLAKPLSSERRAADPTLTAHGALVGTMRYMSPEQLVGGLVDQRTDIFAFGSLLFEMLTGVPAFAGATPAETIGRILHGTVQDPSELRPGVPRQFDRVVRRCLQRSADARYGSVDVLRADLELVEPGTHGASGHRRAMASMSRGLLILTVLGSIVLLGGTRQDYPTATAAREMLLAVVPLDASAGDRNGQVLATGLTGELRDELSRVPGLRVLSGDASARFAATDARQMADALGVTHVVGGDLRRYADRVHLSIVLRDARSGIVKWSREYDGALESVRAAQRDVREALPQAMGVKRVGAGEPGLAGPARVAPAAYELYLTAASGSDSDPVSDLRRAVQIDPSFAPAWATLAYSELVAAVNSGGPHADESLRAARRALALDSSLPLAHAAIAGIYSLRGQDAPARLSYLRALEIDPNNTTAMANLSVHDLDFGRLDEALLWARRAFALSARDANACYHVALPLIVLREDALARRWLTRAEQYYPDAGRVQWALATVEYLGGQGEAAERRLLAAVHREPRDMEVRFLRGELGWLMRSSELTVITDELYRAEPDAPPGVCWLAESVRFRQASLLRARGGVDEADQLTKHAEATARSALSMGRRPTQMIELAAILAARGDHDGAIQLLTRAVEAGARNYAFIEPSPAFDALRPDPVFRALVERMRDDVAEQRRRAEEEGLLDLDALSPAAAPMRPLRPFGPIG